MKCKDIMTKYLKMCRPDATVKDAAEIMEELNCGVVPIVDENNKIQGIVTDRDIALYATLHGREHEKTRLKEFMRKNVITCHPEDDIDTAINKMKENKIRRIPVVDDENKVIGLISIGDLAITTHKEHEIFETLENISSPVSGSK
jgi:CBS domain-containing protein